MAIVCDILERDLTYETMLLQRWGISLDLAHQASTVIQAAFRGYQARKQIGPIKQIAPRKQVLEPPQQSFEHVDVESAICRMQSNEVSFNIQQQQSHSISDRKHSLEESREGLYEGNGINRRMDGDINIIESEVINFSESKTQIYVHTLAREALELQKTKIETGNYEVTDIGSKKEKRQLCDGENTMPVNRQKEIDYESIAMLLENDYQNVWKLVNKQLQDCVDIEQLSSEASNLMTREKFPIVSHEKERFEEKELKEELTLVLNKCEDIVENFNCITLNAEVKSWREEEEKTQEGEEVTNSKVLDKMQPMQNNDLELLITEDTKLELKIKSIESKSKASILNVPGETMRCLKEIDSWENNGDTADDTMERINMLLRKIEDLSAMASITEVLNESRQYDDNAEQLNLNQKIDTMKLGQEGMTPKEVKESDQSEFERCSTVKEESQRQKLQNDVEYGKGTAVQEVTAYIYYEHLENDKNTDNASVDKKPTKVQHENRDKMTKQHYDAKFVLSSALDILESHNLVCAKSSQEFYLANDIEPVHTSQSHSP